MRTRRDSVSIVLLAAGIAVCSDLLYRPLPILASDEAARAKLTEEDAVKLGSEAYVFGFPLVLMDTTRQVHLNTSKNGKPKPKPNQFIHSRAFPDHTFSSVVSPNADTLYSNAWLDLSRGPVLMSLPDMGKRYYLMQLLDAWSNTFACPGTRTTGNGKGEFAIVGPDWKGTLPTGVQEIRSPTNMAWIIGRTQTNGKDDFEAVHAIQDRYRLSRLAGDNNEATSPASNATDASVDTQTPPAEQVSRMDAVAFFARLNALMRDNRPADGDAPTLRRLAAAGIVPGRAFDVKSLDPTVMAGLEKGMNGARALLVAATKRNQGRGANGWDIARNLGKYGTNYPFRAVVALFALGANLPEDALYPRTRLDSDGQPLTGANRYTIRFTKEQLPPVDAFWSLTLYNRKQAFVENPIGRYAIGDRDPLKLGADGSLTLYVQRESPGIDKQSNWLPAPADEFNLFLRLYWPRAEALAGSWKPPAVERVQSK
jgi:hypothetical protein